MECSAVIGSIVEKLEQLVLDGDLSLESGAQRWPELIIPFEKDNPIKKVLLDGWFDTAAG